MTTILDTLANETKGNSFKTYKYGYDSIEVPRMDYEDHIQEISWKAYGEDVQTNESRPLKKLADSLRDKPPIEFSFFLDGSRRIYKVDDMSFKNKVFPILAGQIGIGCCTRIEKKMHPLVSSKMPGFERRLVIAVPSIAKANEWIKDELYFSRICDEINKDPDLQRRGLHFDEILPYKSKIELGDKLDNKAIAVIQDHMVEREKLMTANLVKNKLIDDKHLLLKDGSLEYRDVGLLTNQEVGIFQSNYQFVIGVSKSFNPENCKDKNGNNNSRAIAKLPLYHRTPVNLYEMYSDFNSGISNGGMKFAVWYVRIRDSKYTGSAFSGILKLEKILKPGELMNSDDVDVITACIINERNPVCYGKDARWANHIYPIYATESYVKSKYMSDNSFLNLF